MENKTVYSATLTASQESQKKAVQRTGVLSCTLVLIVAAVTNLGTFLLWQLEKVGVGANLSAGMQIFFQNYFIERKSTYHFYVTKKLLLLDGRFLNIREIMRFIINSKNYVIL